MYENLPLGEVDSRVGHIAKHEKDKAKNADGTDQEQEDSEVLLLLYLYSCDHLPPAQRPPESGPGHAISIWLNHRVLKLIFYRGLVNMSVFRAHGLCVRVAHAGQTVSEGLLHLCSLIDVDHTRCMARSTVMWLFAVSEAFVEQYSVPGLPLCRMRSRAERGALQSSLMQVMICIVCHSERQLHLPAKQSWTCCVSHEGLSAGLDVSPDMFWEG